MKIENIYKYKDNYQQYLHLGPDVKMKMLWHHGYWDGPLTGLCLLNDSRETEPNNQKYWFECVELWMDNNSYPEDDDDFVAPWWRRFLVIKPTDDQLLDIEARHAKFQRMVGTHCDYNDEGVRGYFSYGETTTKEYVAQYYKEAPYDTRVVCDLNDDQIIGWIEL